MVDRKKIILGNHLSPGDVLVMTTAIRCLHEQYPGEYLVDVDTTCNAVFENNPDVAHVEIDDPDVEYIEMHYPLIDQCNQRPVHFLQGYCDYLGEKLDKIITCTINHPILCLSQQEKDWISQVQEISGKPTKYWIINAGIKDDYTCKNWGIHQYQQLVDMLYGKIQFVQVGSPEHNHRPLGGVIDLIGKTDARQLIRLCWNAVGGVGPITFLMHIFGALQKPYVCPAGGREPVPWEYFPTTTMLSTVGTLPCCQHGGCWKSRVVPINDGDKNDSSLCELPVFGGEDVIPKCMAMISPDDVARAVERYYVGGVTKY